MTRTGLTTCGVAVMAKASAPGRTKTRLVPPLTLAEAAACNSAFLQDVAANLLAAAQRARLSGFMAFGPPGSEPFFEGIMPPGIGLIETWFPNFGDCLFHAASTVLTAGYGAACVLNSDSPTLPTELLVEAAEALARPGDRAVLGPSSDGGYYLLGIKRPHRPLFEGIAWSTERVAEETLARARGIGLDVHVLPTWYDIDDAEALRLLWGEVFERRSFHPYLVPCRAAHTAALLQALADNADLARRLGIVAGGAAAWPATGGEAIPQRIGSDEGVVA